MVLCFVSFVFRSKNVECDIKVVTGGMKCSSFIFYFILIFFFLLNGWSMLCMVLIEVYFFFKMEFRWDNLITMTTARFLHRFFYTGNHFVPNVWSVGISLLRIIVITLKLHCPKRCILSFYSTTKKCFNVQEFLQTYSCIKFAVHLFIIKVKPMWFLYSMFMYRNCDFSLFFGWFFFFTYCILWWNSEISVIKKEIWDFLSCYYHNMYPLFKRHFSLVSSLIRTINTWTYMYFFLCVG